MSDTATYTAPGTLTPAVTDMWDRPRSWTLESYRAHGGYRGLERAKTMGPEELVNLVKDGKPVRMSKRAGTVITLDDLVEAIGIDAARYSLVRSSVDSTLDIDLTLWANQSNENPVYYVQYAHARLSALSRNAADLGLQPDLANIDPDEFNADGLGRGKDDEPQPASHFISRGFARGAAPGGSREGGVGSVIASVSVREGEVAAASRPAGAGRPRGEGRPALHLPLSEVLEIARSGDNHDASTNRRQPAPD